MPSIRETKSLSQKLREMIFGKTQERIKDRGDVMKKFRKAAKKKK